MGTHLNTEQHTTLVQTQRTLSKNALAERNMQHMVDLATQSQLLREAAEAFVLPAHNAFKCRLVALTCQNRDASMTSVIVAPHRSGIRNGQK
jgi:hypothetical protein